MKIGEKFIDDGRQYEVVGTDGAGRPISKFVGLAKSATEETTETPVETEETTETPVENNAEPEKNVTKKRGRKSKVE